MNPFFALVCIFVVASPMFIGCQQKTSSGARYQIPMQDETGAYKLQVVELGGMSNAQKLEGPVAKLYVDAKATSKGFVGASPEPHFLETSDGVLVPKDFDSMQLTAMYVHMYKLKEFDQSMGLDQLLSYPRRVGLQIKLELDNGGYLKNNAMYLGGDYDFFIFVPYDSADIPTSLNGGVIAHEHFHSLFEHFFSQPLAKKLEEKGASAETIKKLFTGIRCDLAKSNSTTLVTQPTDDEEVPQPPVSKMSKASTMMKENMGWLRAINEGMADVWGWLYSQNDHFIENSFPNEIKGRSLDRIYSNDAEMQKPGVISKVSEAYKAGNYMASIVRYFWTEATFSGRHNMSFSERQKFATQLVNNLKAMVDEVADRFDKENLTADFFVSRMMKGLSMTKEQCQKFADLKVESSTTSAAQKTSVICNSAGVVLGQP